MLSITFLDNPLHHCNSNQLFSCCCSPDRFSFGTFFHRNFCHPTKPLTHRIDRSRKPPSMPCHSRHSRTSLPDQETTLHDVTLPTCQRRTACITEELSLYTGSSHPAFQNGCRGIGQTHALGCCCDPYVPMDGRAGWPERAIAHSRSLPSGRGRYIYIRTAVPPRNHRLQRPPTTATTEAKHQTRPCQTQAL